MTYGTTIQIFLPDGNPRSLRMAEITSRTIQAFLIPRAKLDIAEIRSELRQCSVYFLIGASDEDSRPTVYIGEAEDGFARLKQQNKAKDFWVTAVSIVSKTQHLTKTHVKYLEWLCHDEAVKAARYSVDNSNIPTKPFVSEPVEADLHDNFETIKLLISTLGHPIFDKIAKPQKKHIVFCSGKDASANGEYTEDGLIVFSGSKCNLKEVNSAKSYVRNARQQLINTGLLKQKGNVYEFTANYIFASPSRAAAVVLAREANGWIEWKYDDGKTLDEVHRHTQDKGA